MNRIRADLDVTARELAKALPAGLIGIIAVGAFVWLSFAAFGGPVR